MNKAFTLIEVSLVIAMVSILLAVSTFSLTGLQHNTYVDTTLETLMSDIKQQQLRAMSGDTQGGSTHRPHGIVFETDRYILFSGVTYDPADPLNLAIGVNDSIELSTSFPQTQIIFSKGSGEMQGFTSGQNTITILNTVSNNQKILTINQYGVITAVN